jgi:hypothetical protein
MKKSQKSSRVHEVFTWQESGSQSIEDVGSSNMFYKWGGTISVFVGNLM